MRSAWFYIPILICTLLTLALQAFGTAPANAYELVIPALEFRTGPYAPSGIPLWSGFSDYFTLLNERDGGIKGVKIKIEVCETAYDTKRGVECYEKLKSTALAVVPGSTGIAYELIPKTAVDHVPIVSPGYGRTSSADGRVFPWVFNFPATYWSGASIIMKYIADQERGEANLKGKKIALLYLNSAYGREPLPILAEMAKKRDFQLLQYPVDPPGQNQDQTWAQIERDRPDWILLWGFGAMNQVAVSKAASIHYPMGHFIGNWWASAENDVQLAGAGADGYLGTALHAPGAVAQSTTTFCAMFTVQKKRPLQTSNRASERFFIIAASHKLCGSPRASPKPWSFAAKPKSRHRMYAMVWKRSTLARTGSKR